MTYIDGFVTPVPKNKIDAYKEVANKAGAVWMEYGALAFVEALADDVPFGEVTSFPRAVLATEEETVAFNYIVYASKEHRDEVMQKIMDDPRVKEMMTDMPFDGKRMIIGGFEAFINLSAVSR